MIRSFCRPPHSRSVLLGVLSRNGNGAANPTQRSSQFFPQLNQLQTLASLRPLLVSLRRLSWPPAEAFVRRPRHSSFFKALFAVKRCNRTDLMALQEEGPVAQEA